MGRPVQGSKFDGSGFKVSYYDLAQSFLAEIAAAEERQFPSEGIQPAGTSAQPGRVGRG